MKNTNLKNKLTNNKLTIGSWITIGHISIPEILSNAGFDWLVIDIEHSSIDHSMVHTLISVIQSKNIAALVRVNKNEETVIKRVLDAGADGIIVPKVCSCIDARLAVKYAHYPPSGERGVGLYRAQNYGYSFNEYNAWLQSSSVIIAQIEHKEAVNNINEIISTPGIDGVMIGPYDLSGSLGSPGDFSNLDYLSAIKRVETQCKKHDFPLGAHVIQPDERLLSEKIKEGYTFLAFSTDFFFLGNSAVEKIKNLKSKLI